MHRMTSGKERKFVAVSPHQANGRLKVIEFQVVFIAGQAPDGNN